MTELANYPPRDQSAGWLFKSIAIWIDTELQQQLKQLGMSRAQFPIMMVLLEKDGQTQAEIGKNISMPGYATSRNIDQLENQNYVKRHSHESSKRCHRIFLTPEGRELAPVLFKIANSLSDKLLDALNQSERKTLKILLKRVMWSINAINT